MSSPAPEILDGKGDQPTENVLLEFLKLTQGQVSEVVGHGTRGISVYFLITGGLLKFALDQAATPFLAKALCCMGLGLGLIGFCICLFLLLYRRKTEADIRVVFARLGMSDFQPHLLLPLKYLALVLLFIFSVGSFGWIFLLFYRFG
jgi:hypothetical protein